MESRLALQALAGEADLNFDELDGDLQAVQGSAREAFEAASLVHQGAPLDAPWAGGPSRPRAIFARHSAAVRQGAHKVTPSSTLAGQLERSLWQLPIRAEAEDAPDRPKCTATVRSTGDNCVSAAIHLGGGVFGTQCYSHASTAEREQYKIHHKALNNERSHAHAALLDRQREAGVTVIEIWLQHRETRPQPMGDGASPV